MSGGEVMAAALAAVLLVVALFEVIDAITAFSVGDVPGESQAGAESTRTGGVVALLAGAVVAFWIGRGRADEAGMVLPILLLAAAALTVASHYAFDPYYAPSERRYSDAGLIPTAWIGILASTTALGALLVRLRASTGFWVAPPLLVVSGLTVLFGEVGH